MFRSTTKLGGQAHTIGYLANAFVDPYQVEMAQGLMAAARAAGANLLCFVGGPLPADPEKGDGSHRVYDLATSAVCDGFIVSGTGLSHEVGTEGLIAFCKGLGDAPACCVGVRADGLVTANPDNEGGMERVVCHLIESHGARRLALVRGPWHNDEAEGRARAFRSALARHQIPLDEELILAGDFTFESGGAAAAELLARLGGTLTGLDAIVASNDRMAIGVIQELQRRGISVPDDIAVTGFDDIVEAELTQPPLTTLRQAMPRLGQEAMRLVLQQIQHSALPESQMLNVDMVLRRSCGCSGLTSPQQSLMMPAFTNLGGGLLVNRQRIQLELTRVSRGTLGAAGRGWEQRLFADMVSALQQSDDHVFLKTVQTFAERVLPGTGELNRLDEVLRELRRQLVPLLSEASAPGRDRMETLMHTARTLLFDMSQRALHNDRLGRLRWNRSVAAICNSLSNAPDYAALQQAIRSNLPLLGIEGAVVVLYDQEDDTRARAFCAFDRDTKVAQFEGEPFPRSRLLPDELAGAGGQRGHSYTVQPLVWRGHIQGHLLLELEFDSLPVIGDLAQAVAGGLSRAALAGSALPWAARR